MGFLQLKIVLGGITPRIWRRFLVSDALTFHQLHNIIQVIMGWENYHLYSFNIGEEEISEPDPEFGREITNSKKTRIKDRVVSEKQKFSYIYDFGDDWEHTLIVEKISSDSHKTPICLAGERACPPEDCGSVPGYYELMKIKRNKNHPEYEERILEWLGEEHDFERFDIISINKQLSRIKGK